MRPLVAAERGRMKARITRNLKQITTQMLLMTTILTATKGVNHFLDHRETWYNLPMEKIVQQAQEKGIPGEYWIREDGVKMYGEYVICAANYKVHPYGSTVDTSLGKGLTLDTGGFAKKSPTTIDIATDW